MAHPAQLTRTRDVLNYICGGHAVFTLVSRVTGVRYTYKCAHASNNASLSFVSLLSGPDNYRYIGCLFGRDTPKPVFRWTKKSKASKDAKSVQAIYYLVEVLTHSEELPEAIEFWHKGACARCGRDLTDPQSIKVGMGPICRDKV